jgi:hypothetical protein
MSNPDIFSCDVGNSDILNGLCCVSTRQSLLALWVVMVADVSEVVDFGFVSEFDQHHHSFRKSMYGGIIFACSKFKTKLPFLPELHGSVHRQVHTWEVEMYAVM